MSEGKQRLAVVVVPGVGDAETSAASSLARTLVEGLDEVIYSPGDPAEQSVSLVVDPDPGEWRRGSRSQEEVSLVRLRRRARDKADRYDKIDVYELGWSDLSRFPRGLPGFVATFFGLALQVGTLGLEALARLWRGKVVDRRRTPLWANAASWVAAALVVPVTAAATVAAVNFWLAVEVSDWLPAWFVLAAIGVLGWFAIWFVAEAIASGGWNYGGKKWAVRISIRQRDRIISALDPRLWAIVVYVGFVGLWSWRYYERGRITLASSDTLLYAAGFVLRPIWLLALTVVAVSLLVLTVQGIFGLVVARMQREQGANSGFRGRWVSGVLASVFSPLAVALVGTLLFAGLAGVAFKSAADARWGSDARAVTCFTSPSSWHTGTACGNAPAQWPRTAEKVATLNEQASVLVKRANKQSDPGNAVDLKSAAADLTKRADALEAQAGMTPVDWAQALFVIVAIPVMDVAVAVLALAVTVSALVVLGVLVRRRQPGRVLARLLLTLGSWPASLGLLFLGLAGIALTWCVWLGAEPFSFLSGDPWDSQRAARFAGVGAAATALLLIGRFLPIDLTGWGGSVGKLGWRGQAVGGNLEALRARLDPLYDIASYLRIYDGEGIRPRIIARFRALLRTRAGNYDGLLIVGHSQGSVLSAAVLFGDRYRREPEGRDPNEDGVRGWERNPHQLPPTVLLTCGCPLRQSYDARLSGDYSWLWAEDNPLKPVGEWLNVYRARDAIGQAVFREPLTEEARKQGRGQRTKPLPDGAERIDVCLIGTKGHTGYWTDAEFARWVDYAILRLLGDPNVRWPDRYEIIGSDNEPVQPDVRLFSKGVGALANDDSSSPTPATTTTSELG
jgi:hypothetical protein